MALSTAWERVATGCDSVVATCRQTVEIFPGAFHRLGAGGYGAAGGYGLGAGGYGAAVAYTLISCHLCREAIRRTRGRRV
jgi:hypothetical protein